MEKHTIIYLGLQTEVTGNYQLEAGQPDFCVHKVLSDNKDITHKMDLGEFKAIETLVLNQRNK